MTGLLGYRRIAATFPASAATGLLAATVLGLAATALGTRWPVVGAPVVAVVAGAALSPLVRRHDTALMPGLEIARTWVLQLAVVLLGAQLSLGEVAHVGLSSLPVMLSTLAVCLLLARFVGARMGIGFDLRTLIGVGTGVCGASAIAAASPTIRARTDDVAYAISTIFLFNVAAVLAFPPLGRALGLGQHTFGLFAGTAVNDTSSVVAAATSYGTQAGQYAVVVKLVRSLTIIPICLVLAAITRDRQEPRRRSIRTLARLVPWFLLGFLALVGLDSAGLVGAAAQHASRQVALTFIAIALGAIGLSTDPGALRRAGAKPLVLGLILWIAVASTSLAVQRLGM